MRSDFKFKLLHVSHVHKTSCETICVINTFFMQSAAVWSGLCFTDLIKREVKRVDVSHTVVKVSDFLALGHNEKTFFYCCILFGPQFKTSKQTKNTLHGGYSFMFLAAFVVDLCIKCLFGLALYSWMLLEDSSEQVHDSNSEICYSLGEWPLIWNPLHSTLHRPEGELCQKMQFYSVSNRIFLFSERM